MINCHTHIFLEKDVPEGFPNKPMKAFSESKVGYSLLKFALHNANPFSRNDSNDKLLQFIKEGRRNSQREVYSDMAKNYPSGTQFVVLTMDMNYMGCGKPARSFWEQCNELNELKKDFPILPFLHMDCRRGNLDRFFEEFIIKNNWAGVKMYPPLGVFPQDERYYPYYKELERLNKPIITHCTYGNPIYFRGRKSELIELLKGKYNRKLSARDNCAMFTDPDNWGVVAELYPKLRIDLAHAGGSNNIIKWLNDGDSITNPFTKVKNLARKYENIYFDISYTASEKRVMPVIYQLLCDDILKNKCLFGDDSYMVLNECSIREFCMNLKFSIGIDNFKLISEINPKIFLSCD